MTENRCVETANKIAEWIEKKKMENGNEKYSIIMRKAVYGNKYIVLNIISEESKMKFVRIVVKSKGNILFDVKMGSKLYGLDTQFRQRVLWTKKWLRIECGYSKVEQFLKAIDGQKQSIQQALLNK